MDNPLSCVRILVVEDEIFVLMETEDMLADLGCESVTAASTVDQAIALIEAQHFDAALFDVNLKGDKSHLASDVLVARRVPFAFAISTRSQMRIDASLMKAGNLPVKPCYKRAQIAH